MKLYRYLPVLVLLLAVSCGPAQRVAATLDDVESYINERPDSALAVLRALDADSLRGPGQRARAALLHQMALDKCYIDITSDSVLAPAFWFLKHGTADQKLKTWYYRSVLAGNAGDIDAQMLCLVRGEQYIPKAKDPLMAGRLYTAKRVIFIHLYDLENASENAEKAAEAFFSAKDRFRYYDAIISLANIYNLRGRNQDSERLLDTLRCHWSELSVRQKGKAFGVELKYRTEQSLKDQDILTFINNYLTEVPSSQINWVRVAKAYLYAGETEKAKFSLLRVREESLGPDERIGFLMVCSDLYQALGQEEKALTFYEAYRLYLDQEVSRSLSSRAKFLAEEENFLADKRKRSSWIWILSAVSIFMCVSALIVKRRLRERQQIAVRLQGRLEKTARQVSSLQQQVRAAEREAGRWKDLLLKEQLPAEVRQLISERVAALQRYSFALASRKDSAQALSELESSVSRDRQEQFLRDLTLQYGFLHPELPRFFQKYRLTEQEKTSCTLLAMGCKTKEIASMMQLSEQRCYNIFNTVRRRLGLHAESKTLYTLLKERIQD